MNNVVMVTLTHLDELKCISSTTVIVQPIQIVFYSLIIHTVRFTPISIHVYNK